jgi:hypothetical protein
LGVDHKRYLVFPVPHLVIVGKRSRLFAITPWIIAVWHTWNIYFALLIHGVVIAFAGINLLTLILRLT